MEEEIRYGILVHRTTFLERLSKRYSACSGIADANGLDAFGRVD